MQYFSALITLYFVSDKVSNSHLVYSFTFLPQRGIPRPTNRNQLGNYFVFHLRISAENKISEILSEISQQKLRNFNVKGSGYGPVKTPYRHFSGGSEKLAWL
jgi:hypothetical protein